MLEVSVGDRFGDWTITSNKYKSDRDNNKHYWLDAVCKCGMETTLFAAALTSGKTVRCKNCGNLGKRDSRILAADAVVINSCFSSYKKSAKKRGLEFELTREQFSKMIFQNCEYCGATPKNSMTDRRGRRILPKYNGVDRVDNMRGYHIDNVVTCCRWCNEAKRAKTHSEFSEWIEGLIKNYHSRDRS